VSAFLRYPFVYRQRFARGRAAARRGANYARYMAQREGVVLQAERDGERGAMHAAYMAERPGSSGLFGPDPGKPPELATVQAAVRAAPWHWQSVLSLFNEDGHTLGIETLDDWRGLTRRALPEMARVLHVEESLRWVGAMHRKDDHNHVHLLLWLEGGVRRADLSREELRQVRRVIAREVYGPLRQRLDAERAETRELVVMFGRHGLEAARRQLQSSGLEAQAQAFAPDRFVPPLPDAAARELGERIAHLAGDMPGRGQAALAYMPPALKAEVREIADRLLGRPECAEALDRFRRAVRSQTELYVREPEKVEAAWRRARGDLRDRVAQHVVRAAAGVDRAVREAEGERKPDAAPRPEPVLAAVADAGRDPGDPRSSEPDSAAALDEHRRGRGRLPAEADRNAETEERDGERQTPATRPEPHPDRPDDRDRAAARLGRQVFAQCHRVLTAEAWRAEAQAELGQLRARMRAETRGRVQRRREMDLEEERE
jgi:hypothetical protein